MKEKLKRKEFYQTKFYFIFATVKNKTFPDLLILNCHGLFILFRFYLEWKIIVCKYNWLVSIIIQQKYNKIVFFVVRILKIFSSLQEFTLALLTSWHRSKYFSKTIFFIHLFVSLLILHPSPSDPWVTE